MGTCTSCPTRPVWLRETFVPMYVLPVSTFLQFRDTLPHYEELMRAGQLVKRNAYLHQFCIFISHQWLSSTHPDPKLQQLPVLQKALQNLLDGHCHAQSDVASQFFGESRRLTANERRRLADGYIWLDWFSIPQEANHEPINLMDLHHTHSAASGQSRQSREQTLDFSQQVSIVNELQIRKISSGSVSTSQDMYITSIPFFVEVCDLFLALVPRCTHTETGRSCNFQSWLGRGWCRMEMWCSILSVKGNVPFLVVKGVDDVSFAPAMLVADRPPHEGDFTVEADRKTIHRVMQRALENRIQVLKDLKQWDLYRFTLARYEVLLGQPMRRRNLDEFMKDFCFPSLESAKKNLRGLGPVECAILSHDHALIPFLANFGFPLSRNVHSSINMATLQSGRSTLDYALEMSWRSDEVLRELLKFQADVNRPDRFGWVPLGACKTVTAVEMLLQHRADVNQTAGPTHVPPLTLCTVRCAPAAVLAKLIECGAQLEPSNPRCLGVCPPHPLANLAIWSPVNPNCLEAAQLLLDAKSDINLQCQGTGIFLMVELASRGIARLRGPSWGIEHFFAESTTTPVGFASFCGGDDYVEFLLLARADPQIPNARGNTAVQLAHSQRIIDIMEDFENTISI